MSDDLIKRLRKADNPLVVNNARELFRDAADALERLQSERDHARNLYDLLSRASVSHKKLYEQAEAELARLTPTEEEKKEAKWLIRHSGLPHSTLDLFRKFVLKGEA